MKEPFKYGRVYTGPHARPKKIRPAWSDSELSEAKRRQTEVRRALEDAKLHKELGLDEGEE